MLLVLHLCFLGGSWAALLLGLIVPYHWGKTLLPNAPWRRNLSGLAGGIRHYSHPLRWPLSLNPGSFLTGMCWSAPCWILKGLLQISGLLLCSALLSRSLSCKLLPPCSPQTLSSTFSELRESVGLVVGERNLFPSMFPDSPAGKLDAQSQINKRKTNKFSNLHHGYTRENSVMSNSKECLELRLT